MMLGFSAWIEQTSSIKYWGPYSMVTVEGEFLKIEADALGYLYVPVRNNVTNIGNGPINQKLNPPWVKYFEYVRQDGKNIITYAENRAVDCVPYSRSNNAVYLINRNKDPKGIAIPGGFFDNKEDGFDANNPPIPTQVAPRAAARELGEETGASVDASRLVYVGEFDAGGSDKRERHVKTWAYLYEVPDGDIRSFRFGDDASQALGSTSMVKRGLKGWYAMDEVPALAFGHHNMILKSVISRI
jgi:ADP-ribose pyrophosphatase YjhB (NUDIX family)